jgi:hypothetical protein
VYLVEHLGGQTCLADARLPGDQYETAVRGARVSKRRMDIGEGCVATDKGSLAARARCACA